MVAGWEALRTPISRSPYSSGSAPAQYSKSSAAIGMQMMKTEEGNFFRLGNRAGFLLGMIVMWVTALFCRNLTKTDL